jgi:hypothetical protein
MTAPRAMTAAVMGLPTRSQARQFSCGVSALSHRHGHGGRITLACGPDQPRSTRAGSIRRGEVPPDSRRHEPLRLRVSLPKRGVREVGMRSTAIRALCFVVLALGGVASGAAVAGAQLDPIRTVTSAVSTVVSDLTGSVTSATSGGSGATGAVSGATDAVSGSASESNRGSPHTRFDRLPRRYESLLERIESGRNVGANIARLRALLASASPQIGARVMRFIRLEIRRLERGGLTRRERAAVRRLRTLLTMLQGQVPRPATQRPSALGRIEGSGIPWATESAGGVAAATAGSESDLAGHRATSARDEGRSATRRLPLLPPSSDPPYWPLLLLILAATACLVLLLTGPPRHLLPSPVRGMVEVRRPEVLALAVAIGLGLVMGLVTVLLVQTALF